MVHRQEEIVILNQVLGIIHDFNDLEPQLQPGDMRLLDAPGITGMGSKSTDILQKHVENGYRIFHRIRDNDDGPFLLRVNN